MTFPAVASTGYSEETADTTTHDVVVPSGIVAGDLLMLWASIDDTTTLPSISGWTSLFFFDGPHVVATYYKFASGSETDFTYTTSVSQQSANLTWRVVSAHASSPPEKLAGDSGFMSTYDCPIMTPSWGSDDTMWVVFAVWDNGTLVSYPTNYNDNQYTDSTGVGSAAAAALGICSRNIAAASEDPGVLTLSTSTNTVGIGVAIRPAAAAGGTESPDPFGMSGFFGS